MKLSKNNIEPYTWGDNCLGWRLVQNENLSITEESMPPGTKEVMHMHRHSQQVFYILSGEAIMKTEDETMRLLAREYVNIPAGVYHEISNESSAECRFLVISHPDHVGDRINKP